MKRTTLTQNEDHQETEMLLITDILNGNPKSLNTFLKRHQGFIYNIALKMSANIPDAEDATQEILLRLVTKLSKYNEQKGSVRAWIYRLAFNHLLNMKDNPYERNKVTFSKFFDFLENVEDHSYSKEEELIMGQTIEEAKINCTTGMLMCLDREERLMFIIGDMFRINHQLAAEVFEITPENFRKRLSRARHNLRQWMTKKCGLVNANNPCRCKKKTKGFIENGWVDPDNMLWTKDRERQISQMVGKRISKLSNAYDELIASIYSEHPVKRIERDKEIFHQIMNNDAFKTIID